MLCEPYLLIPKRYIQGHFPDIVDTLEVMLDADNIVHSRLKLSSSHLCAQCWLTTLHPTDRNSIPRFDVPRWYLDCKTRVARDDEGLIAAYPDYRMYFAYAPKVQDLLKQLEVVNIEQLKLLFTSITTLVKLTGDMSTAMAARYHVGSVLRNVGATINDLGRDIQRQHNLR